MPRDYYADTPPPASPPSKVRAPAPAKDYYPEKEQPSLLKETLGGIPSYLAKGALGFAGLPGDLDAGMNWVANKIGQVSRRVTGRASSMEQAAQQQAKVQAEEAKRWQQYEADQKEAAA